MATCSDQEWNGTCVVFPQPLEFYLCSEFLIITLLQKPMKEPASHSSEVLCYFLYYITKVPAPRFPECTLNMRKYVTPADIAEPPPPQQQQNIVLSSETSF